MTTAVVKRIQPVRPVFRAAHCAHSNPDSPSDLLLTISPCKAEEHDQEVYKIVGQSKRFTIGDKKLNRSSMLQALSKRIGWLGDRNQPYLK